jgi:hypothetical protein
MPNSTPSAVDPRVTLGARLLTYIFGSYLVILALQLVGGAAGPAWPTVLAIVLSQCAVSAVLGSRLSRPTHFHLANYGLAATNWTATTAIIAILGGYPSPVWVIAVIGAYPSSFFLGHTGALLNAFLLGLALVGPNLGHLDGAMVVGAATQTLITLIIGLVTDASFTMLFKAQEERQRVEGAEHEANERLTTSLTEQSRQAGEMAARRPTRRSIRPRRRGGIG